MLKNYLFSPLCSTPCLYSSPIFLFFQRHTLLFLFFSQSAAPFSSSLFFQPSFSFLLVCCPLFFSPKYFFFQPKRFSAQKHFFSPKRFCFSPKLFSVQPKTFFFFVLVQPLFSSSFFCFILFWFCPLFFLSAPPFVLSLAPFIQDPKFSLAASHLFYLNKSLFSSNME